MSTYVNLVQYIYIYIYICMYIIYVYKNYWNNSKKPQQNTAKCLQKHGKTNKEYAEGMQNTTKNGLFHFLSITAGCMDDQISWREWLSDS